MAFTWARGQPLTLNTPYGCGESDVDTVDLRVGSRFDLTPRGRIRFEEEFIIEVDVRVEFRHNLTNEDSRPSLVNGGVQFNFLGPDWIDESGIIKLRFAVAEPIRPWATSRLLIPNSKAPDSPFLDENVNFSDESDTGHKLYIDGVDGGYAFSIGMEDSLPFDVCFDLSKQLVGRQPEVVETITLRANEWATRGLIYSAMEFIDGFGEKSYKIIYGNNKELSGETSSLLAEECFIVPIDEGIYAECDPDSLPPTGGRSTVVFRLFTGCEVDRSDISASVGVTSCLTWDRDECTLEIAHISTGEHALVVSQNGEEKDSKEFHIAQKEWYIGLEEVQPVSVSCGEITQPGLFQLITNLPEDNVAIQLENGENGSYVCLPNNMIEVSCLQNCSLIVRGENLEGGPEQISEQVRIEKPTPTLSYNTSTNGGEPQCHTKKLVTYRTEPNQLLGFTLLFNAPVSDQLEIKGITIDGQRIEYEDTTINEDGTSVTFNLRGSIECNDKATISVCLTLSDDTIVEENIVIMLLMDDRPMVKLEKILFDYNSDGDYQFVQVSEAGRIEAWTLRIGGVPMPLHYVEGIICLKKEQIDRCKQLLNKAGRGVRALEWGCSEASVSKEFVGKESMKGQEFRNFRDLIMSHQ